MDKFTRIFLYVLCSIVLILDSIIDINFCTEDGFSLIIFSLIAFNACSDIYECIKKVREKLQITVKDKFQYSLGGIFLLTLFFNLLFI